MKKHIVLSALGLSIAVGLSYQVMQGNIFNDVKKGFQSLGNDIKNAANKVGNWVTDTANDLAKAFSKIPDCAEVVGLGTEWASKKAAYAVANATLQAAMKLQTLDPRRTAIKTQIAALEASKDALKATKASCKAGIEGVRGLAEATNVLGQVTAKALEGGFNIERMEFSMNLADLKKGKLPKFGITAIIAGEKLNLDVQINLSKAAKDIAGEAKMVVEQIVKNVDFFKKIGAKIGSAFK